MILNKILKSIADFGNTLIEFTIKSSLRCSKEFDIGQLFDSRILSRFNALEKLWMYNVKIRGIIYSKTVLILHT